MVKDAFELAQSVRYKDDILGEDRGSKFIS